MNKKRLYEWFDVYNKKHIQAYRYYIIYKEWPEDFDPNPYAQFDITFIEAKMIEQYINLFDT